MSCTYKKIQRFMNQNKLLFLTLIGVCVGIILGFLFRNIDVDVDCKTWIKIWGELFLRMLKVLILPLIMCCLITGIASLESGASGRLGILTVLYVYANHLFIVTFAVIVALIIKPGQWWKQEGQENATIDGDANISDIFADFLRNLFPENIIKACLQNAYTTIAYSHNNLTNTSLSTRTLLYRDGTNTLGVIVFSAAIGFALSACGKDGEPFLNVIKSLEKIIFTLMKAVIWYSPIGIASLITGALIEINNLQDIMKSVGIYVLTVQSGCVIYHIIFIPLIYLVLLRKNPFRYHFHLLEGILSGIAPPSSAAAIPYLMTAGKEKLHLNHSVVDFTIPVLSTINRGGSALFVAITAVFIAQSYGMNIGLSGIAVVIILTSALCPAVGSVPSSSIVILMTVCSAMQIPIGDRLAVIFALEWLQDRVRTSCNIASTGYGPAIIQRFCKHHIKSSEKRDPNENGSLLHQIETENNLSSKL